MFDYAVCEIAGKQIIVTAGKEFTVPFLGEISELECARVLMISEKGKLSLGAPFLKEKIKFEVLSETPTKKTRVAFYKPKANHRKVTGHNGRFSKIRLGKAS